MRNPLLIFISILLFSCGGSDGDAPTPEPPPVDNTAPSVPELLEPADGLLCTDNPLDFSWATSIDPDGDSVQYEIEVATNNSFSEGRQVKITSNLTHNFALLTGTAYYWRVRSKDNRNNFSSYSSIYKFYTEGEGVSNHLPYAPTLISPELNADIVALSTTLKWSASDVDDDPLTFDVYFGNTNPPVLIEENITATEKSVDLNEAMTYYWKIVVKDGESGESVGQIWSFNSK